ncbi:MAG TPA: hypothetical protein PLG41_02595 [Leptospiraceae bacterium]|nr:hypothetical protein [Leptospiraceae bacterium]
MLYKVLIILLIITLNHCYATDRTKYIDEYTARQRLYLITILKCNISGGTSKNNLEVFAFVEKNFSKTYTLTEGERKKVTYFKKDVDTCERNITAFDFKNCNLKDFDLLNLLSKGQLCKLEPASFFQF